MKRQRGVALVEFALVLPVLLVMTLVTTELGRAYYQYNTIVKSVREAVRYLSVRAPGVDVNNARNIVVYGNPDGRGAPLAAGLSLSNVPAPTWGTAGSFPTLSTVTVSVTGYTFVPMVGQMFGVSFANITFAPIRATMRSPS
jgi:hypothetical protein